MGKQWPGVKVRAKSVQIWFHYDGQRRWHTLDGPPTDANIAKAGRLRHRIKTEIELGVFDYGKYFPGAAPSAPLFFDVAAQYLAGFGGRTRDHYKSALNRTWAALFEKPVNAITYDDLLDCLVEIAQRSAKHYNNELIPLRGVFGLAMDREIIQINPAAKLKQRKHQRPTPDPFTAAEREDIINHFYRHYGRQYGAYVQFGFATGMRHPSEIIALDWADIEDRTARVVKRRTRGQLVAGTKTNAGRDVRLNDRAMAALSKVRNDHATAVFTNPETGQPFIHGDPINDRWTRTLAALEIRHRKAYNMRHTAATEMLERGVNPAIAAEELGHSVKLFLEVYAKWINKDRREQELAKMDDKPQLKLA